MVTYQGPSKDHSWKDGENNHSIKQDLVKEHQSPFSEIIVKIHCWNIYVGSHRQKAIKIYQNLWWITTFYDRKSDYINYIR